MSKIRVVFLAFLFIWMGSPAILAEKVELKANHPERYVVKAGDTLWGISAKFLKDPWLWPSVWYANPQVANPHLIYPGDAITLVYVDGKPQLRIDRGRPLVKITPKGHEIPLDRPIPTIPLDAILPFLAKHRIVTKAELDKAPYVVYTSNERVAAAAMDKIYVRGVKNKEHKNFIVVRGGTVYKDPVTKELLGYEARYIGNSDMAVFGDPSTHYLTKTTREVLIGDKIFKDDQDSFNSHFVPHAPKSKIDGQIIAVMDGVSQIGLHQVVVINRGKREGVETGHVLAIYQKGEWIKDSVKHGKVRLPDTRAGLLMVFKAFDKLSYAIVMRAQTNMHVLDIVRNP